MYSTENTENITKCFLTDQYFFQHGLWEKQLFLAYLKLELVVLPEMEAMIPCINKPTRNYSLV